MTELLKYRLSVLVCIIAVQFCCGLLVRHYGIRVNYTRKIVHFSLFFIPALLRSVFPYQDSLEHFIIGCVIAIVSLIIYIRPIRENVSVVGTMFLSIDRPEDRPHTLWWLFTQVLAGYMIFIPSVIFFAQNGLAGLIWIPLLIIYFGDGLAEPVGVRFGKHRYETYAFFSKKKYVRTLEGSACVFFATLIVIAVFHSSFSQKEFITALIVVPALMTLVEAFSPHTWDTPTLLLAGYGALYGITRIV
jgi:phytol kinase